MQDPIGRKTAKEKKLEALAAKKRAIDAELARRDRIKRLAEALLFDKQLAFVRDPAKFKILFTPRRCGKSFALAVYMLTEALLYPNRKFLYLGLSQESAQNILMTPEFEAILEKFAPGYRVNHTVWKIHLPNGSMIRIGGLDATPSARKRLLGGKYHMCVIDECQDQTQDLKKTVDETLAMAVSDYVLKGGGVICMSGTPGDKMGDHYWYQCTKQLADGRPDPERARGWSVHEWSVPDNPFQIKEFSEECIRLRARDGENYQETDEFKSQWLGRWVTELKTKVYKFHKDRNLLRASDNDPKYPEYERLKRSLLDREPIWKYVVGVDLGYEDDTAFVVGAWNPHDNTFYIVESQSQNHITMDVIGGILVGYNHKYKPLAMVVDTAGGGKLIAESLRDQFRLPIRAAIKQDKDGFVAKMNGDFFTGHIKVIPETNAKLIEEWNALMLDRKKLEQGIWKEAEKYKNHLTDAALYAYKEGLHTHAEPEKVDVKPGMADQLIARMKQQKREMGFDPWQEAEQQEANRMFVDAFRRNK